MWQRPHRLRGLVAELAILAAALLAIAGGFLLATAAMTVAGRFGT